MPYPLSSVSGVFISLSCLELEVWISHTTSATPDLRLPFQPWGTTALWSVSNYTAWWLARVNNFLKIITWKLNGQESTSRPLSREFSTPPPCHRKWNSGSWLRPIIADHFSCNAENYGCKCWKFYTVLKVSKFTFISLRWRYRPSYHRKTPRRSMSIESFSTAASLYEQTKYLSRSRISDIAQVLHA